MNSLEQAQNAWANAVQAHAELRSADISPSQRTFNETFVPRAKQDTATLAQLAQAEALTRIAASLETLIAVLQAGHAGRVNGVALDHNGLVARKRKPDDQDS